MAVADTWHEHIRLETDTAAQSRKARNVLLIAVVSAAVAVVGLVIAFVGPPVTGWVLFAIAACVAVLYAYLWSLTRKMAQMTGDDLIDVVVADEGIRGPGGLKVAWLEISAIDIIGIDMTVHHRAGTRHAMMQSAVHTALESADLSPRTAVMILQLKDYDSVLARTSSEVQRNVLTAPMRDEPGSVVVPLASRSNDHIDQLLAALVNLAPAHNVAVRHSPA